MMFDFYFYVLTDDFGSSLSTIETRTPSHEKIGFITFRKGSESFGFESLNGHLIPDFLIHFVLKKSITHLKNLLDSKFIGGNMYSVSIENSSIKIIKVGII